MRNAIGVISAVMASLALPAATSLPAQAAINGTLYAVIAPTYSGSTLSYIRLFNGGAATSTFTVTLVGSPSGRTYGTATIQVPSNASIQYPLTPAGGSGSIQTLANATDLNGGDTSYSLYIQDPDSTAGYQHVTYNNNNAFFENNTICMNALNASEVSTSNAEVLTNVHSTMLPNYPSTITISNYWNAAVNYRLNVRDARTGVSVGQTTVNIPANSTYTVSEPQLEQTIGFTPNANQQHLNIFVVDSSGGQPNAVVGQSITNNQLNAQINMTMACAVNAPAQSTGFTGGISGY